MIFNRLFLLASLTIYIIITVIEVNAGERQLSKALQAARAISSLDDKIELTAGELAQLTLFIETDFKKYIRQKIYYLPRRVSGLARSLEHDPKTGYTFIHLGNQGRSKLGRGAFKQVSKSILYDRKNPIMVARCLQSREASREIGILQHLQGLQGIVEVVASTEYEDQGTKYTTIFSKLYSPGAFLHRVNKRLTVSEKMKVVSQILQGLEGMQARGVVHRDIKNSNYLLNIKKRRHGKRRKIQAVISDFGLSRYVTDLNKIYVEERFDFIAPEALFPEKMSHEDYFRAEIFAVGCSFYELFYEMRPPWQEKLFFSSLPKAPELHSQALYSKIVSSTMARRLALARKKERGLSAKEEFEALILRMVHPEARLRGNAALLRKKMAKIIKTRYRT